MNPVTLHYWYAWAPEALLACFGIAAAAWKLLRAVFRIDAALPTLYKIDEQFRTNGGSSLKDDVNIIKTQLETQAHKTDVLTARLDGMVVGLATAATTTRGETGVRGERGEDGERGPKGSPSS